MCDSDKLIDGLSERDKYMRSMGHREARPDLPQYSMTYITENAPPADTTYLTTPEAAIEIDAEVDRLKEERRQAHATIEAMDKVADRLRSERDVAQCASLAKGVLVLRAQKKNKTLKAKLDQACGRMECMWASMRGVPINDRVGLLGFTDWFKDGKALREVEK